MQKTSLYRHFDAEGRLLYVGVSCHFSSRTLQHMRDSHWYFDIVRIEIEHFPNRMRAERAEAIAIRDENPLHNVWQEAIIDMKDIEEFEDAYAIFEMAAEGCPES